MHALGMARTAQVKRDARIGEAEAKRDSGIKVHVTTQLIINAIFITLCSYYLASWADAPL